MNSPIPKPADNVWQTPLFLLMALFNSLSLLDKGFHFLEIAEDERREFFKNFLFFKVNLPSLSL